MRALVIAEHADEKYNFPKVTHYYGYIFGTEGLMHWTIREHGVAHYVSAPDRWHDDIPNKNLVRPYQRIFTSHVAGEDEFNPEYEYTP